MFMQILQSVFGKFLACPEIMDFGKFLACPEIMDFGSNKGYIKSNDALFLLKRTKLHKFTTSKLHFHERLRTDWVVFSSTPPPLPHL